MYWEQSVVLVNRSITGHRLRMSKLIRQGEVKFCAGVCLQLHHKQTIGDYVGLIIWMDMSTMLLAYG